MKLIATFITACLAVTLSKSDNNVITLNDCSAQLNVEKNRSSKSADEDGAQFILTLTNTSKETKTFSLDSKRVSQPCGNNKAQYHRGTSSTNVDLNVSFQNNSLNRNASNTGSNDKISLSSGESYRFIVNVTVPEGTPFNIWSCIEVEVKSTDCKAVLDSKTLSVFVTDPSEG